MPRTANKNMWNHKCSHCGNSDGRKISEYEMAGQEMTLVECGKCHNLTLIRFDDEGMTTSFKVQ